MSWSQIADNWNGEVAKLYNRTIKRLESAAGKCDEKERRQITSGRQSNSASMKLRRNAMKSSIKDQAQGKFHKVKGKLREIAGKLSMKPKLEAEGKDEKRAGKVQEKIGQVKNVLGK